MEDIGYELRRGTSAKSLAERYSREKVLNEIWDLIDNDMADDALPAAIELKDPAAIRRAARIVIAGNYLAEITRIAKEYGGE